MTVSKLYFMNKRYFNRNSSVFKYDSILSNVIILRLKINSIL